MAEGQIGTGSRVQSFPRAFPSSTDVPILLLNQPIRNTTPPGDLTGGTHEWSWHKGCPPLPSPRDFHVRTPGFGMIFLSIETFFGHCKQYTTLLLSQKILCDNQMPPMSKTLLGMKHLVPYVNILYAKLLKPSSLN